MLAPPFFQSAERGDLKFWGEDDGSTVVVWESLSESEQEQWSKMMGKSKDWMVCRSREKDEEQRPFEVDGKEIFSNRSKKAKPNVGEKTGNALESVVATGQHQMRCEQRVCLVLGSPRLPCGRRAKSSVEESSRSIRRNRRMSSAIERERTRLLNGHGDRHAWRLWVSGPSTGR